MLPGAVFGESDAMYATREKFVWAFRESSLHLWIFRKLRAVAGADGVLLWGALGQRRIDRSVITKVHVDVDRGGSRHRVMIATPTRSHRLASKTEAAACFDPTYDGINLLVDAAWAASLGRAVASILAVPCEIHEALC